MSINRCFSIVGDSNIKWHMTPTNCRDRPLMSGAQVVQCGHIGMLATSLGSVRAESSVCVLSCLTNFLTSSPTSDSASLRAEHVLLEVLEKVTEFSGQRPDVQVFLCPPMYRTSPIWYREGLPEILKKFSDVMKAKPPNSFLMPSFPTPQFQSDGVHLTAYSGLEFVLHLFDSVQSILDVQALEPESRSAVSSEATRVLEDRMMVLEQDHRRLNQRFEAKSAVDSELSDWQENIRNEYFFMIQGLKRLPKLEPREWQERAKRDVLGVLSILLGRECSIKYVKNSTGKGKDAKTLYKVAMSSPELYKETRDTFGSFFLQGGPTRPESLKGISIRNCVTTATLARIAILQLYGKRYEASNPGSSHKVVGYEPRPYLKIFPASDASDKRIQQYTFIEAVSQLPSNFTESEIDELLNRISPKLHGNLKSTLVVLSDDMLKSRPKPKSSSLPKSKGGKGKATGSKGSSKSKSPESKVSSKSKTPESSRSLKRGASGSPEESGPSAKK